MRGASACAFRKSKQGEQAIGLDLKQALDNGTCSRWRRRYIANEDPYETCCVRPEVHAAVTPPSSSVDADEARRIEHIGQVDLTARRDKAEIDRRKMSPGCGSVAMVEAMEPEEDRKAITGRRKLHV